MSKNTETLKTRGRVEPQAELSEPDPPRLDVVFGTLQNRRRRWILRYLADESPATIGELAEHIAAIENDVPQRQLNSTQRKRVYVSLYQSHLPKLDDAGAVSYDRDRGTVELSPDADEFLNVLDRYEDPVVRRVYLPVAYSLIGVVLFGTALVVALVALPEMSVRPSGLGGVVVALVVGAVVSLGLIFARRIDLGGWSDLR